MTVRLISGCKSISVCSGFTLLQPCTQLYRREALEDLLNEYEVDLVLSGHVHSYSRICNVLDWRCADEEREGGMTHVTVRHTRPAEMVGTPALP